MVVLTLILKLMLGFFSMSNRLFQPFLLTSVSLGMFCSIVTCEGIFFLICIVSGRSSVDEPYVLLEQMLK